MKHITKVQDDTFLCAICKKTVSEWDLNTHVQSKFHVKNVEMYEWSLKARSEVDELIRAHHPHLQKHGDWSEAAIYLTLVCTLCRKQMSADAADVQTHFSSDKHRRRAGNMCCESDRSGSLPRGAIHGSSDVDPDVVKFLLSLFLRFQFVPPAVVVRTAALGPRKPVRKLEVPTKHVEFYQSQFGKNSEVKLHSFRLYILIDFEC
jgi:hypothetical protein